MTNPPSTPTKLRKYLLAALRFAKRAFVATVVVSAVMVCTQDIQIFPRALPSILTFHPQTPPAEIEVVTARASDGHPVTLWRLRSGESPQKPPVLLFHGNGELLSHFVGVQRWFRSIGFTTFAMEYRGYGGQPGWPSESGIYADAEAALFRVSAESGVEPQDVIVFGNSIGAGPAAYVAHKYASKRVVLIAPYTSIPDIVREMPLFGFLSPLLWYDFPIKSYVERMNGACIIAAHGKNDTVIPYHHSPALRAAFRGPGSYTLLTHETAGHNDVLGKSLGDIEKELARCLSSDAAGESA